MTLMPPSAPDRNGVGALLLVLLFVAVMAITQLAQHRFLGTVTVFEVRATHGSSARAVALSAIEEVVLEVGRRANDPGSSLHRDVRDQDPGRTLQFTMEPGHLPLTTGLLGKKDGPQLELEPVRIEWVAGPPITILDPAEREGTLTIEARVRTRDGLLGRTVRSSFTTRLCRLTRAPPLDRYPVVVRRPRELLSGRWDVNRLVEEYLGDDLPELIRRTRQILVSLEDLRIVARDRGDAGAVAILDGELLPAYRDLVGPGSEGPGRFGDASQRLSETLVGLGGLPVFPGPSTPFMLVADQDEVELESVDIQARLTGEVDALNETRRRFGQAEADVLTDITRPEPHRRYLESARRMAGGIEGIVERVIAFRRLFRIVREGDPDYLAHTAAYALVDPQDLARRFSSLHGRASMRLVGGETGSSPIGERLESLFRRLDPEGRGVHGIVLVENPAEPLTLTGVLKGAWTLAISGEAEVRDLSCGEPDALPTLVILGGSAGRIRLGGCIQATCVVAGSRLEVDPGTRISGGLMIDDLPGSSISGRVVRDARALAGAAEGPFRFLVSPWIRSMDVDRD